MTENSEKNKIEEGVELQPIADEQVQNVLSRVWSNLKNFMHGRFDLKEGSAPQEEVVESVRKGIDFRGTNLWVLMFAVFIASLGLNMNSTAVIIGAMLVSPLMGPITGIGLSLGINDFDMLKTAWRNFLLMVVVSLVTSTFYFFISPISTAQSELLARTSPTTYDVLIAFFGGLAGMVAQTRKDKAVTVVSGVAIATALMPPLCTAGFGLSTGNLNYLLGALYLFTINAVFIAVAAYLVVLLLRYEKKTILDPERQKKNTRYITIVLVLVGVPSLLFAANIVRRTAFEENVDRYVNKVFQFNRTMIVDYTKEFHYDGDASRVEVRLVGDPLSEDTIDNARAQMESYGLHKTELVVKQANSDEKLDIGKLQKSYADIIEDKNTQIRELRGRLSSLTAIDTLSGADISRELALVTENIGTVSLSKHITYNNGQAEGTSVVAVVKPADENEPIDLEKIRMWLSVRTKNGNVKVIKE
ncbi:MAG: DUF389 domain-containing protein [Tidjanibacter sp.]|nr:DUF389 domain-containing protein [Tidjanibacter sp.]